MIENKQSNFFLLILILMIFTSVSFAYYRYMIREDFVFFTDEESIPDRFNIDSYK